MSIYIRRSGLSGVRNLVARLKEGSRFGPKGAMIDGGRVFHQQSFDLDKYLYDVKGYTDAEVQQLERDGKLVALLSNKKIATGKVIPEDVKTGWYVLYNVYLSSK
jgi:hypothetical protein